ncbi:MAG TPA: hypothetical protein PKI03_33575, partial [Pseudomonadota bacterium]|nr:hypothetical protein [Pseudomonadota bacterium]
PRTDLYALGVVLYQMVCGKLPFSASTFLALIAKTVNEPPPPLRSQNSGLSVPGELEALVMSCLAKEPDSRPETAEVIAEALDQLLAIYPDENLRSGEISVARSTDQLASAAASGGSASAALPAGGVARTVQRLPAVKPTARSGVREPNRSSPALISGAADSESDATAAVATRSGPTSLSAAFAAVEPASARGARPDEATTTGESAVSASVPDLAAADPDPAATAGGVEPTPPTTGRPKLPIATGQSGASLAAPHRELHRTSRPSRSGPVARNAVAPSTASGTADPESELAVPRRSAWIWVLAAAAATGLVLFLARNELSQRLWHATPPTVAEQGPLVRARELLAQRPLSTAQIDEALRILREQRELANSPEVQRLLSLAYEAQDNRLRALGHLYAARQLGGPVLEQARSELALAQLLSRLGHAKEACLTARKLLLSRPATDIGRGAQALIETEHCP